MHIDKHKIKLYPKTYYLYLLLKQDATGCTLKRNLFVMAFYKIQCTTQKQCFLLIWKQLLQLVTYH